MGCIHELPSWNDLKWDNPRLLQMLVDVRQRLGTSP